MKAADVKQSLLEQLESQNRRTVYTEAWVEDYMKHFKIKQKLNADITKRGIRVHKMCSSGVMTEVANESIKILQNEEATMLKILQTLGLQDPVKKGGNSDYL